MSENKLCCWDCEHKDRVALKARCEALEQKCIDHEAKRALSINIRDKEIQRLESELAEAKKELEKAENELSSFGEKFYESEVIKRKLKSDLDRAKELLRGISR